MNSYSLAISTFFGEHTPKTRLELFKKSINSLISTNFKCTCFIVDDGSITDEHIKWLLSVNDPRIKIFKRSINGGVSRCKNTCIRLILENGNDVGFLADDDVVYKEGWDIAYFESMRSSGVHHFNFFIDDLNECSEVSLGNGSVLKTPHTNGCFMTFTREIFDIVGNFLVMPSKYGHEHGNFTMRCLRNRFLPFTCDIVNARDYLEYPEEALASRTVIRDEKELEKNYKLAVTRIYERIVDKE